MRGKPLVLVKNDSGCIVPLSHKLNQDGYFRTHDPSTKGAEIFGVSFGTACKWVRKWKVQRLSLME